VTHTTLGATGRTGRRWLTAGLVMGGGSLLIAGVGPSVTLAVSLLVGRFLPERLFSLLWLSGAAVSCVLLWFLVRRCVRAGGWRSLLVGVGVMAVVGLACSGLGVLTQSVRPGVNGMAGAGWVVVGYELGLVALLVLAMGFIAMRTTPVVASRS
jgi:hypothetical protein